MLLNAIMPTSAPSAGCVSEVVPIEAIPYYRGGDTCKGNGEGARVTARVTATATLGEGVTTARVTTNWEGARPQHARPRYSESAQRWHTQQQIGKQHTRQRTGTGCGHRPRNRERGEIAVTAHTTATVILGEGTATAHATANWDRTR